MNQANIKAYNPALHNVRRAPKCAKLRVGSYLATNGAWDRKYVVTRITLVDKGDQLGVDDMYNYGYSWRAGEGKCSMIRQILRVEYTYIGRYFASKACRTIQGYNNGRAINYRAPMRNAKNVGYVYFLQNGMVINHNRQVHVVPKDFEIKDLI